MGTDAPYIAGMATLIAYRDGIEFYRSERAWLYPLLDLEAALTAGRAGGRARGRLTTYDKIVGRAGALLSARLGVEAIEAEVVSRRALDVLWSRGIEIKAALTVDQIDCATEELLARVDDPDEAHRMILRRIEERRRA